MKYLKSLKMLAILTILNCQNSSSVLLPDGSENLIGNIKYQEMENYLRNNFGDFFGIPGSYIQGMSKNKVFFKDPDTFEAYEESLVALRIDGNPEVQGIFDRFYAKFEQKDKQALQAERARTAAEIARLRQEVANMDAEFEEIYQNSIPEQFRRNANNS